MSYQNMKLHLGCGEVYLDGYLNIDYPPASHTVQTKSTADEYHNILELSYPSNSIEEIRLHHVFEHFTRASALGLLAAWWTWLKPGSMLRIEVPDFDRTARSVLNPFTPKKKKMLGLRHIFGSQEADWAFHMEGWSSGRLRNLLESFGYHIMRVKKNAWRGTYNVEIFAVKTTRNMQKSDFESAAYTWISDFMVDESPTEQKMRAVWMEQFRTQISKSWAKE